MNVGKEGEKTFKSLMEAQGVYVVDVSMDPLYWRYDIDFIIMNDAGVRRSVEVKNDTYIHNSDTMYIEIANPRSKGGQGWLLFCKADYLAYGDAVNHKYYFFRMNELRDYVLAHKEQFREVVSYDDSHGLLVKLADVAHLMLFILE